jgi:manganese/zinc/iron transport system permease protein
MSALLLVSAVWERMDTEIALVGALCAGACALPGTYLVLRRMSMMGDAISHAVLPGLAAAFLLTGSRDSLVMLVGAGVVGVLTALLTQWIHLVGRVESSASMGVVFTVLFAIGLILIRQAADHVDLDPDCVLYGAIEYVPLDRTTLAGLNVPRALVSAAGIFLFNLLFVLLFYKELKISSFDPGLATTLGIRADVMHYLLMTLVAVTTVVAFESVGSILVIAMLIVPPATAHLLTERLGVMLLLGVLLAVGAAPAGHWAAITAPGALGFEGVSTSTAGMMAVVAGLLFLAALLAAPRHGLVSKLVHRAALSLRIAREDLLGLLHRREEQGQEPRGATLRELSAARIGTPRLVTRLALLWLRRQGLIVAGEDGYRLTPAGREAASRLIRSHRLWETYLGEHLMVPTDHLHEAAEQLEHVTDAQMRDRLAESVGPRTSDPTGHPIPPTR